MKIFFDTEFIEDGSTIDLISIGLVREDGEELYLESSEAELHKASFWVYANVFPSLVGYAAQKSRRDLALEVMKFVGAAPEFWAYYAAYDWVALCQLYGRMVELPNGWPMYCRDLKQLIDQVSPGLEQPDTMHHALADARWVRNTYRKLVAP